MANKLAKLPSLSSKSVANHSCDCGCGLKCHNMFRPGHDARVKGGVIRFIAGMPIAEIQKVMGKPFADAVIATLGNAERLAAWGIDAADAANAGKAVAKAS